ncbi:DUF4862 family protein [Cellulomonas chengniuliangii]|uniref:DUF4862 family protein n=1 Tax=Cellulomonas chengniuliangii TaxID=2968084 RepID=A0ABY5L1F2_9CELL|nr:DUF4862 family protein [Cellulomonas chengniuliangii]MCC2307473.1 DUF4862 family protein [Cellulomonas chengniuliangii]UUI75753.1 DUF4862 family protein [Cellulomonas chengniuliangii]
MTPHPLTGVLLGAYAMAPAEPEHARRFYAGVAELGVDGLELPLRADMPVDEQAAWEATHLDPSWDLLVTCIPTVMGRLKDLPGYGLSSTDEAARARALDDVAQARDLALRLADQHGRRRVVGIQVHSAPGPDAGSREALTRSLAEIASWDLAGAELLVEHCDARVPGQAAAKGFWSLEDEIAAVRAVADADAPIGLSLNWGRSAIEGRSAQTPVEHARAAREAGLLRAVVLSGASDVDTAWGPAWGDAHIAPRGGHDALAASAASLLGVEQAAATLAAGEPEIVAVKISVRPADADVATRLAVARAALEQVAEARARVARDPGAAITPAAGASM